MKKEQTPRRKPVMRGALEGGCASWAPIRPAGNKESSGNATASNDPQTTPDAVTGSNPPPSSASDAKR
ncbi:hypothetical protein [Dechloromonas sp. A34]|uniref:hypothetical protein n=1 Tax=Dechloromonas sp. A34 TaxID=447588 RepID=UPI002248EE60|nr:hypothetical protein [Dechloromonas sp. A34]